MVLGDQQHMIVRPQAQQAGSQERALGQVERLADFFGDTGAQPRRPVLAGRQGQGVPGNAHRRGGMDHWRGALTVSGEGGAQRLVARHQRIEALLQGSQVQCATQVQRTGQVIGGAVWLKVPKKQLPLLGEGQRKRLGRIASKNRCHAVQIDTLLLEQHRQRLALLCRQCCYRFD
ncbi:hypothetical protein D3C81_640920 [compost metagenome]